MDECTGNGQLLTSFAENSFDVGFRKACSPTQLVWQHPLHIRVEVLFALPKLEFHTALSGRSYQKVAEHYGVTKRAASRSLAVSFFGAILMYRVFATRYKADGQLQDTVPIQLSRSSGCWSDYKKNEVPSFGCWFFRIGAAEAMKCLTVLQSSLLLLSSCALSGVEYVEQSAGYAITRGRIIKVRNLYWDNIERLRMA